MTLDFLKFEIPRFAVALVIIASGLGIPFYFLFDQELSWPNPEQWVVVVLYLVIVIAFALMGAGVKGVNITSPETDKRIARKKSAFDKAAKPYLLTALVVALLWAGFLIYELMRDV